ncbi:MAG: hypothetical protein MJA83_16650 [Gammaproteobacteria bacterium]|nr:hypothetical protein [Gammaproteobacteria bacterium]
MAVGRAVARRDQTVEVVRYRDEGPQLVSVQTLDNVGVVTSFEARRDDGTVRRVATDLDQVFNQSDSGYLKDGTTTTFSGQSLTAPVIPGSVLVESTTGAPALRDFLKDGRLFLDGNPRKRAASGSFATMANETMTIRTEFGDTETVTFGTEATIADAVATINSQLKNATAVAQGSQDVDLLSKGSGVTQRPDNFEGQLGGDPVIASIEVVTVDSGITTKLGISTGKSTTEAGTVNYFTGALDLTYPGGYSPSTDGDAVATVTGAQEGPFDMQDGDILVVDTNGGGLETATFNASSAVVTGAGATFATMAGETMEVTVGNGPLQFVTFGTEASQAAAIQLLNDQLNGVYAEAVDVNNVRLVSNAQGTGARLRTSNVAAGITAKIGLPDAADQSGAGDVADINAVTPAEVKTVVEADITGLTVNIIGSKVQFSASTSIDIWSSLSTLGTILGLSVYIANVGTGNLPLLVDFISGQLIPGLSSQALRVSSLSQTEELVGFVTANGNACQVTMRAGRISSR